MMTNIIGFVPYPRKFAHRSQVMDLKIGLPSNCKFAANGHSEMRETLKRTKEIHKVCLAQAWVVCKDCGVEYQAGTLEKSCACYDNLCLAASFDMLGGTDGPLNEFSEGCHMHQLEKGQGLVGKAYLSRRPYFCRDISQFTSNEYPLVYYARHARLSQSFAICLHHSCSNNYYILELFFNPGDCEDPQYILGSIMTILQKSTSLKVAFGEESSRVEVIQPSMRMCQTTLGTSGNGGDNSLPSSTSHQQEMVEVEEACSGSDVVVNDSEEKSKTIPSCPQDTKIKIPLSYETLEQHFGRKLEDAAESLGVSRSTLKRILRQHEIPRWPSHKRKMPNSKQGVPPLYHLIRDHNQPVATIGTAMHDVNTMTVKAKHRNDFLKFELPFSSGLVELKEQLSRRLESNTATYKIRYLDGEGDPCLIACDEDLKNYMSTCRSRRMTTINISVLPLTN